MASRHFQEVQEALRNIEDTALVQEIQSVLKSRLKPERTIPLDLLRDKPAQKAEQDAELAELPRDQRKLLAMVEAGFNPGEIAQKRCCNETEVTHDVRRAGRHLQKHII